MAEMTGPIVLRGGVYLVTRGTDQEEPNYTGGELVARVQEIPSYRIGNNSEVFVKGSGGPAVSRHNGDYIELSATFVDFTSNFMSLITNRRSDGTTFIPGETGPKLGHLLRATNYNAVIIRDEQHPMDYPALYIPYCLVLSTGWLSARSTKHVEVCEVIMTSVDYEAGRVPPFQYGMIADFIHPPTEEE